jgi:site-specific DNA recombinase
MNIAIYPRKSKKDDNSESMEQQIDDCRKYINKTYPDANIIVYSGDYAITGHSTAKRKDFQRMMDDVRAGRINAVVIMRYDRIARNMRDFCNLYHDMMQLDISKSANRYFHAIRKELHVPDGKHGRIRMGDYI